MPKDLLMDLEKILALCPAHVYWLDRNNVYQGCNERQAISAGLSSRFDIVGKRNCDLPWNKNHPEIATLVDNMNLEVMLTGVPRVIEEPATLLDGTELMFLSNKMPIYDDAGKVVGLIGISVDITSQKLNEARLKSEKKETAFTLDYILAHIPAHVYWKSKDGVYLGSNDKQAKSLGLNYSYELIGKTDFELPWKKKDAKIFRKNDLEVMNFGIMKTIEEPATYDGKEAIVLSQKVPLRNSSGEITGVFGLSIDITGHKRAEELHIKHEAAKKVITFTNKVAGSIAHELRTPLAIINTQTDLQNIALSSDKSQREKDEVHKLAIKNTKATIKASAHVIDDMLIKIKSFSQGKIESTFNTLSITTDIDEFLSTYPFKGNEKKLVKLKNFDSLEGRFKYLGDSVLTKHIFSNLMKNSLYVIKEAERGNITIELKAGDAKDKFNYLIFRDTAAGVAPEYVDKMFNHFESKKGTAGGTGLGLSFCKMVMETYGGDITCKSTLGEYIEFILSFPKV